MGLQETVVKEEGTTSSAWRMCCSVCGEHSQHYSAPEVARKAAETAGWLEKSYYLNTLFRQDWYCPKCTFKKDETRDTIPDDEELALK